MGPSVFFAGNGNATEAKKVCRTCAVADECLSWALDHPFHTRIGVWGGVSEPDRRALRRRAVNQ